MNVQDQRGQVNLLYALLLVGTVITGVWIWKRLPYEIQDVIVDYGLPVTGVLLAVTLAIWFPIRAVRRRRRRQQQRARLMARFEREADVPRRVNLAFELIELNGYQREGLERCASAMVELFLSTLQSAVGDKQHRLRGMAASHLGVLQDKRAIPALLKALEDDHAYVRSCAALGLGRLRALEARETLRRVSQDDWDQTVRSRAREALERMV